MEGRGNDAGGSGLTWRTHETGFEAKAESGSKRYGKNTQHVSHRCGGLSQHSHGGQVAMATVRTTGAGSNLRLLALVAPVPVCPLRTGTGELKELCPRSHSPCLPERITLQIYYQGKGALPSHCMYPLLCPRVTGLFPQAPHCCAAPREVAVVRPPKAGPPPAKSSAAFSSSRLSYVFPAASRVLCSVTSNSLFCVSSGRPMSWKHLPVPAARSDTEVQSKNKEGIPARPTGLGTALSNKPLATGLSGARTGLCLPIPLPAAPFCQHLPPNTPRCLAALQENVGFCLKQPISMLCNRMKKHQAMTPTRDAIKKGKK